MHTIKPSIWIGKKGCTEGILREITAQLEVRDVIKVRWLRNTVIDPEEIAVRTNAVLLDARGRTIVLRKRKRV
jgi:RNA-binding protein